MGNIFMASRDAVPGLGEILRKTREKLGISQVEVGERSGVDRATLSLYEADKKTPGIAVLRRLARAYGVRTCDLIPELEDGAAPMAAEKPRGRPRKADAGAEPAVIAKTKSTGRNLKSKEVRK